MKNIIINNSDYFKLVTEELHQGKEVVIHAQGNSMLPFLHDGDKVLITPFEQSRKLDRGLIVLAHCSKEKILMHRIYQIKGTQILLKGDGNIKQTEEITSADILGIALQFYRKGKWQKLYTSRKRFLAFCWRLIIIRRIYFHLKKRKA